MRRGLQQNVNKMTRTTINNLSPNLRSSLNKILRIKRKRLKHLQLTRKIQLKIKTKTAWKQQRTLKSKSVSVRQH